MFGRSNNTTRSIVTGSDHATRIQLPALPPAVAHSRDESTGYPDATPSTALTAACADDACDDAVTDTPAIRARFADATASCTTTDTESTADAGPSDTVNWNTYDPADGAVNDGLTVDADTNDTAGPAVCTHWNPNAEPSGSDDADPSNVTDEPVTTT